MGLSYFEQPVGFVQGGLAAVRRAVAEGALVKSTQNY
jgi:hypothetical protein